MKKFIKGKDGKFKGSVPSEGTAPKVAPATPAALPESSLELGEAQALDQLWEQFKDTRYTHHKETIATISRVLSERIPGLTSWSLIVDHEDREQPLEAHLAQVNANGVKIYDRFASAGNSSRLEDGELDERTTAQLLDVELLAQRLDDLPTLESLASHSARGVPADMTGLDASTADSYEDTVTVFYFEV